MKKLFLLIAITLCIACSSSQEEQNTCVGKTVKSINEGYTTIIIIFTDGSSLEIFNNEFKATIVKIHK